MSIFLTIHRHRKVQQAGKVTPVFMRRAIAFNITGLPLTLGAVMVVAGKAGACAAQVVSTTWSAITGILSAIAVGLIVGVGIGLLVR